MNRLIPFQVGERSFSLFVILVEESIQRIKEYDPAEITLQKMGPPWNRMVIKDVIIAYATPAELIRIDALMKEQRYSVQSILKYLSRGWKFKPEVGDNDEDYQSLLKEMGHAD